MFLWGRSSFPAEPPWLTRVERGLCPPPALPCDPTAVGFGSCRGGGADAQLGAEDAPQGLCHSLPSFSSSYLNFQGPKGEQGPPGIPGPQGLPGVKGDKVTAAAQGFGAGGRHRGGAFRSHLVLVGRTHPSAHPFLSFLQGSPGKTGPKGGIVSTPPGEPARGGAAALTQRVGGGDSVLVGVSQLCRLRFRVTPAFTASRG